MAKIWQNNYKVEITTGAGFTATADDAVTPGQGGSAWTALQGRMDVIIQGESETTFIPFHAVDHAIVTLTREEVDAPDDAACVQEGD